MKFRPSVFASLSVVSLVASALAVLIPTTPSTVSAAPRAKVKYDVCHRTNAIKNPYRRISVAKSAVDDNGNGHDNPSHDGPVFDVANPVGTHGQTPRDSGLGGDAGGGNDRWGDIFYAEWGPSQNQRNSNNWTTAGQAIFNGATFTIGGVTKQACKTMTVREYIESEREENPNISMADIMTELDDMGAMEDAAITQSLGGSFSTWYASCTQNCEDVTVISSAIEAESPGVTTEPPTNVTTSGATLNGTISPLGTSMQWYFEFIPASDPNGFTSSNLEELLPGSGSPSTAQGPVSVSINKTGLSSGVTYLYRTVGLVQTGSGDTLSQSFNYGVVKQFNSSAPGSPTIDSVTCGNGTLSVAFTAPSVNAGSIDAYEYSTDGGATFALSSNGTSSPVTISSLTNGTAYDVVVRAKAGAVVGLDSAAVEGIPCGTPTATTTANPTVNAASATLSGRLTAQGNALSSIRFIWGTDPQLGNSPTTSAATPATMGATVTNYPTQVTVTGLTPGTNYYYRVVGTYGGNQTVQGAIEPFSTPAAAAPTVTTEPATSVTGTTATINGTGTSNGVSRVVSFTWGTSPTLASGNTTVVADQSPLSSSATAGAFSSGLTGLTPGTTYYFRATIMDGQNAVDGIIRQFTTPTPTPAQTVTTTTTTTVAPSVAPQSGPLGAVTGVAWFDINQNKRRDAGEPLLPGLDVTVTPRNVASQTVSRFSTGMVSSQNLQAQTSADGTFDFTGLQPGEYTITTILPDGFGIERYWDTTGNANWIVTVTVVAEQTARGDFAAIANGLGTGTVPGGSGGTVEATWGGFDDQPGTTDDVEFTSKIDGNNEFTLVGMPLGRYGVRATSKTGRVLANSTLSVTRTGATLTSNGISMSVRIVSVLPSTGATGLALPLGVALAAIPTGAISMGLSRRRRRR